MFNIVFNSGVAPTEWTTGVINPIFKNKGEINDPSNYRPITLLSCFGKLFTGVLNSRLQTFSDMYDTIIKYQAGFRKGFSTIDNMFVLHAMIDILHNSRKKLFCAFVDLKGAFDTVHRASLWHKLKSYNIDGKFLSIVKNMYDNAKSCVFAHNVRSDYFPCTIGVRQGENLSPLLFSYFVNDLHNFFTNNGNLEGVCCSKHELDHRMLDFLKLFVILYADDTLLLSESAADFQLALNTYSDYCDTWKLTLNTSKTKVLIFSNGRVPRCNFKYKDENLEIVDTYKYLGVLFSRNGSYAKAKNEIAKQATKAMYCLIKKAKQLLIPFDVQICRLMCSINLLSLFCCMVVKYGESETTMLLKKFNLSFLSIFCV